MMDGEYNDVTSLERPPDVAVESSAGAVDAGERSGLHEEQEEQEDNGQLLVPATKEDEEVVAVKGIENETVSTIANVQEDDKDRIDGNEEEKSEDVQEGQNRESSENQRVKFDVPDRSVHASDEVGEKAHSEDLKVSGEQSEEVDAAAPWKDVVPSDSKGDKAKVVNLLSDQDDLQEMEQSQVSELANATVLETIEQTIGAEGGADGVVEQPAIVTNDPVLSETKDKPEDLTDMSSSVTDLAPDASIKDVEFATQEIVPTEEKPVPEIETLIAPSAKVEEETAANSLEEVKDDQRSLEELDEVLLERDRAEEVTSQVLSSFAEPSTSIETSVHSEEPTMTTTTSIEPMLLAADDAVSSDPMIPRQSTDSSSTGIATPPLEAAVPSMSDEKTVTDVVEASSESLPVQDPAVDAASIGLGQIAAPPPPSSSTEELQASNPTQTSVDSGQEIKQISPPLQRAKFDDEKLKSSGNVMLTVNGASSTTPTISTATTIVTPPTAEEHIVKQIALVLKINKELIR